MKDSSIKTFQEMTDKELRSAKPLGPDNQEQWYLEMEKRHLIEPETKVPLLLRTSQAAKRLGISKSSLIRLIEKNIIKATKMKFSSNRGFEYRVSEDELENYKAIYSKKGLFE